MKKRLFYDPILVVAITLFLGLFVSVALYNGVRDPKQEPRPSFGHESFNRREGRSVPFSNDLPLLPSTWIFLNTDSSLSRKRFRHLARNRLKKLPYFSSLERLAHVGSSHKYAFPRRMGLYHWCLADRQRFPRSRCRVLTGTRSHPGGFVSGMNLDHRFRTSVALVGFLPWVEPLGRPPRSRIFSALPKPSYLNGHHRSGYEEWVALATGILVTFLLAGYMYRILIGRRRVQGKVEERTRQLSLEKARFRAVAENVSEAIVTTDDRGKIVFFNPAAEHIFGHDRDEILGTRLSRILPELLSTENGTKNPQEPPPFNSMVTLYESAGDHLESPLEVKGKREGGEELFLELSAGKWNQDGETYFTLIIRDITERKQTTQELTLFNDLVDQSNDSIFVIDPRNGNIEDVNETACEILGYSYDEILGMNIVDLEQSPHGEGDPEYRTLILSENGQSTDLLRKRAWQEHVSEVIDRESMLFECQLVREDGTTIPVEMSVQYVTRNDKEFLVKVARDITERKRTEEKLRRKRRLLSESQKMVQLGSFEWDTRNDRLIWSKELCSIFDVDPDTTDPTFESFLERVHPEDRARVREEVENAIEERRDFELEERIIRPDGSVRYLESKGEVLCDRFGVPDRVRGTCLDVTERKRAEREIRAMNEKLEDLVRERTRELEQFVYAASHDLREPLRVLQNYTEFLNDDIEEPDEQVEEDLRFINQAACRMNNLLDSLLKLSQVGRSALDLSETELGQCVDTALENLKMSVDDIGVETTRAELPSVRADAALITDLYQNLIGNALKYAGGESLRIRFTAEQREDEWVFGVKDNGKGISPENHEDIFKPFYHLEEGTSGKSTGIGLSICKRIVERHGGEIWVESDREQGAHFLFTLHPEQSSELPDPGFALPRVKNQSGESRAVT